MHLFAVEVSVLTPVKCEATEQIYSDMSLNGLLGCSCVSDMGLKVGFNLTQMRI